jgi:predicted DNA-binding WGR domain protein
MQFLDFLARWLTEEDISTEDVLARALPLLRDVIAAHRAGCVAPLEGLAALQVEGSRIWFPEAARRPVRTNEAELARVEQASRTSVEVLNESRRTRDINEGEEQVVRADLGERGAPLTRPVFLPGYVAWEHELQHHDPLTDIFSLGLLMVSLACRLNLSDPADLETFVAHRRNLFAVNPGLHPALAQVLLRMTELDRHRRAQDLPALLHSLENYRDQTISLAVDLARTPGFRSRDVTTRQEVVLTKLRDRLFDISRRNNLLHFRPTMQSVNLTHASLPLMLDIRNIREDQVLIWNERLRAQVVAGQPISLNKHLNFNEALYLPSLLERIISDARRDKNEVGFAQLRLVLCFLSWTNLKEKPVERFVSPLALLPVRLVKNKGIRDTYLLEPLSGEAEVNPVLRHQFRHLYNIDLPEIVDLATTRLETLCEFLTAQIQASEPAVTLTLIDRPRIDLIHEKAQRRLDQYRRSARVSGRGVRHFGKLDYSYDPANFHPLAIKLFAAHIRTPGSRLREIIEERPRPRAYAAPPPEPGASESNVIEAEKSFFQLRDAEEANPFLWNFDLCNLTVANFRYRRMSLVRDFETILQDGLVNPAFEATFSLTPRAVGRELPAALPLEDRFDVVPCDPTQATAVAEVRRGGSYIIQGPPGTGKSQTITNLIADVVARGKRVLFVCEKRAAIDVVFARLRQCGLNSLCSLIHDTQTDKKEFVLNLKQTYEQLTEEAAGKKQPRNGRDAALRQIQENLAPLQHFEVAMASPLPGTDLPVRQMLARGAALAALSPAPNTDAAEDWPTYREWHPHAVEIDHLERAIRDLEPTGVFSRHPLGRLSPDLATADGPSERVAHGAHQALELWEQLTGALAKSGIPAEQWNTLSRVQQLLAYMRQVAPLADHGNLQLADAHSDRHRQFLAALEQICALGAKLNESRQGTTAWRNKIPPGDVTLALEQVRQWEGKRSAWLSPAWWRMRTLLRRSYDFSAHAVRPTWSQALAALHREYEAEAAVARATREVQTAFHIAGEPAEFQKQAVVLRDALHEGPDFLRRIHAALVKSSTAMAFVERTLAADPAARALSELLPTFVVEVQSLPLDKLRETLVEIQRQARQAPRVLQVLGQLHSLPKRVAQTLRTAPLTVRQAESSVLRQTWDAMQAGDPILNQFDERGRCRLIQRLESAYDGWLAGNSAEIRRRVARRFWENVRISNLTAAQLSPEQREFKRRYSQGRRALEHEFGKTMRYRAIRELVDSDAALVIQDLKPIWLMSPLSVSDALPLDHNFFDVVIFDEASQVPLEESVPSLFRGRQLIVVGDEMQLPPTLFFAAKRPDEDDEASDEDHAQQPSYELESDSFLNHAAKNLPATMLGWHYRSRSESLISFSNWAFYDGRLLTVPEQRLLGEDALRDRASGERPSVARLLERPLSFHLLADGRYDQRRNTAEANYIADLIRELLQQQTGFSIAVIAFSEAQQTEIESALQRLAQDDDDFRARYEAELEREEEGQFVGLLVKNLENIQGDERDIVILSICYGPNPQGKMLMNFGPINKSGGEKRLNVAFSRAKQRMAVVSSIQSTAITNDYNDGANCLKNYLRYAEAVSRGDGAAAQRVLSGISRWGDSVHDSKSEQDVVGLQLAAALREKGYLVDASVGQSHFHVDLAVRRAGDADYRLGILLDTLIDYEQAETLEREMLRPRMLRGFGWRVAKVLAKDWYNDPGGELQRLCAAMEETGTEEESPSAVAGEATEDNRADSHELAPEDALPAQLDRANEGENSTQPPRELEAGQPAADAAALPEFESLAAASPASRAASATARYFEFREGNSHKFWQITIENNTHVVRFGRIGALGQSQTSTFSSAAAAKANGDRLIREKTRKGYRETGGDR